MGLPAAAFGVGVFSRDRRSDAPRSRIKYDGADLHHSVLRLHVISDAAGSGTACTARDPPDYAIVEWHRPNPAHDHDFNAADISGFATGWNLPNWLLRREIRRPIGRVAQH
jgi:hypothetical protein